jgi:hypothetical protein
LRFSRMLMLSSCASSSSSSNNLSTSFAFSGAIFLLRIRRPACLPYAGPCDLPVLSRPRSNWRCSSPAHGCGTYEDVHVIVQQSGAEPDTLCPSSFCERILNWVVVHQNLPRRDLSRGLRSRG